MSLLRRHIAFVGVSGKVGQECYGRGVLEEDSPAVVLLRLQYVLKEHAARLFEIAARNLGLAFDEFEDKVRRIDLAMRMRVRNADNLTFVFKGQDVVDLGTSTEFQVLIPPCQQ